MCVCVYVYVYIRNTLCEIQAKVSKYKYEITSIKVWFLPLISLSFQSSTWPYSVNIKDIKVTSSQNVLYHMKDDFFVVEKSQKTNKQRGTHTHTNTHNIFIFNLKKHKSLCKKEKLFAWKTHDWHIHLLLVYSKTVGRIVKDVLYI